MWENLSRYLKDKKVLEIGCGIGQKTKQILQYTDNIVAIDISQESIEIAKESFKDSNINFTRMDASKLDFHDKEFDIVITTDSFHEITPEIQDGVLEEMKRVSNTIIFVEPDEISVTNELFKVFDPNENHSLRIKKSLEKVKCSMARDNYKMIETGEYKDVTKFDSREKMFDTLLDWWNDIKVPKNTDEKSAMVEEIKKILEEFDMLEKMEVFEKIHYYIFVKE